MRSLLTLRYVCLCWTAFVVNTVTHVNADTGKALYDASDRGDLDEVKRLTEGKCEDVDKPHGAYNWTPLNIAARENHTQVVKLLLSCKPDVELQSTVGWTALHDAAYYGSLDMINSLIDYGADVNIQDARGRTALHLAVIGNRKEIVRTLLKHGADTRITSKAVETAGDSAEKGGFKDISNLIENYSLIQLIKNETEDTISRLRHSIFVVVISFTLVILTLVSSMIGVSLYFRYKLGSMQHSLDRHAVVFQNEENRQSVHIYEN
ncbi:unnamed protein product, partial [Meganyctiphanes norvegica]|uniref:Ankyrin repeat domain-containing protein n=1 Tax=Meganyctiphanes norvegica TaxID=48144 RepID=A0AAV2S7Z2_MEGNR